MEMSNSKFRSRSLISGEEHRDGETAVAHDDEQDDSEEEDEEEQDGRKEDESAEVGYPVKMSVEILVCVWKE